MGMLIAHRIALDPTNVQRSYFARACGTARFAWNWALAEWQRQYAARKDNPSLPQPSEASLRRRLNSLKREQFPWMFDVTKCAVQEAIIDLGAGFRSFFEKRGRYLPRENEPPLPNKFGRGLLPGNLVKVRDVLPHVGMFPSGRSIPECRVSARDASNLPGRFVAAQVLRDRLKGRIGQRPSCPRVYASSNSDDLGFYGIGYRLPALITGPCRKTVALRQRKAEAVTKR